MSAQPASIAEVMHDLGALCPLSSEPKRRRRRDTGSPQQRAADDAVAIVKVGVAKRRAESNLAGDGFTDSAVCNREYAQSLEALWRDAMAPAVDRVRAWIELHSSLEGSLFAIDSFGAPLYQRDAVREMGLKKRAVSKAVAVLQQRGFLQDHPKLLIYIPPVEGCRAAWANQLNEQYPEAPTLPEDVRAVLLALEQSWYSAKNILAALAWIGRLCDEPALLEALEWLKAVGDVAESQQDDDSPVVYRIRNRAVRLAWFARREARRVTRTAILLKGRDGFRAGDLSREQATDSVEQATAPRPTE